MIKQHIHLLCGIPGSGKSTWAKTQAKDNNSFIVSRDAIRKNLVGEDVSDNKYFSREEEVFTSFAKEINDKIALGYKHIYIDATHINEHSRRKILNQLYVNENTALILEVFMTPTEVCMRRNALRKGFEKVPNTAIMNMARGFKYPTREEFAYRDYGFERISINEHECRKGDSL